MTICLSSFRDNDEMGSAERCLSTVKKLLEREGAFALVSSSKFACDKLQNDYGEKIEKSFELAGVPKGTLIEYEFDAALRPPTPSAPPHPEPAAPKEAKHRSTFVSTQPLNENYTFDEFVTGLSNSWAHAAAKGAARNPGKKGYNPLFIHGGTGLGKTHLMQAIGNEIKKNNPSAAVCYISAEKFLSEYVNSLQAGTMQQFHDRYRNIDVLLVDDVQFMSRGKDFQTEFFNTFNALYQSEPSKQIVMTSDVAPNKLPGIEPRLISRFEGGNLQEIEAPSYETRLAILKKKAESLEQKIPENTLKFIAQHIKSHVRAMEGALTKVNTMMEKDPTIPQTEETLTYLMKDLIDKERNIKMITVEQIQAAVCKKYSITMSQLLSNDKSQAVSTPRQVAMYIARKYTVTKLPAIAKYFDREHPTILHGVRTIEKRIEVEKDLRESVEAILADFGEKLK